MINAPASAISTAFAATGDFLSGVIHSGSLNAEIRRLRQLAVSAEMYQGRLNELQSRIDQLERIENMPPVPGKKRIPARIIGAFPDENRVTLNVGSAEGVATGLPVVTADGLLGLIQTVDSHSSQAVLIWSPLHFKIGAIDQRDTELAGLLHGESWNRLVLELSIRSPVLVGDQIVTSGFSERIPRGISLGRVVNIQNDEETGTQRVIILPSVRLGDVQEVFVLK